MKNFFLCNEKSLSVELIHPSNNSEKSNFEHSQTIKISSNESVRYATIKISNYLLLSRVQVKWQYDFLFIVHSFMKKAVVIIL